MFNFKHLLHEHRITDMAELAKLFNSKRDLLFYGDWGFVDLG